MIWSRNHIKRIILDLSLKVKNESFTGDAALYGIADADWTENLGVNSIELMSLAAAVNSFFNLFEVQNPPYLLSSAKVDDWVDKVYDARQRWDESISFNTSGTSGQAKIIRHPVAYLDREIAFLATIFSNATCIIPYVPSYTIYGFLFTVALPQALQIPVLYPSETDWQQLPQNPLIVGTPFNWQLLTDALPVRQINCLGVSAAAPLYSNLYQNIAAKGIALTEIYGATETSGIAYRQNWQQSFKLFPYWELTDDGQVKDGQSGEIFTLMDDIVQTAPDEFTLAGRKDKQVKVAGKLVDLDIVAAAIQKIGNIKQCLISAKAFAGEVIIQASIVLIEDGDAQRSEAKAAIRKLLLAHEQPRYIHFG